MFLNKISISGFKNLHQTELSFSPKLNYITGPNGAGKTNLLDAVYYLSMTKSYFSIPENQVIPYDSQVSYLCGEYEREDGTCDVITFALERNGIKQFKRNSKPYSRLSHHIGVIPIVMVSPYDNSLINDSGEERRRFLNTILSQIDSQYLQSIQNYNKLLVQRNKLLKSDEIDSTLLNLLAQQMSQNGSYIHSKREQFIKDLSPIVQRFYSLLSYGKERISMQYRSDLYNGNLVDLLNNLSQKERVLKYTLAGIHRDDIHFNMNGHRIRLGGSQGQQKSFLIALKLAQFEIMRDMYDKVPLLLLDDLFDKLDLSRVEALLEMVSSEKFGQIFISDSNKVRVSEMLDKIEGEVKIFKVNEGVVL